MMTDYKIIAPCSKCGCDAKKIIYQNSGPIVAVWCPMCRFRIYDFEAWKKGYRGTTAIFDYWNSLKI